jgi:raffinose/stachyose/melibiose transport system permease protein
MSTRYTWKTLIREIVLIITAIIFSVPLYLLITVSLKTTLAAYTDPLSFPVSPNWINYVDALTGAGVGIRMDATLYNSLVITIGSCLSLIVIGSVTSYVLARRKSKLSSFLFVFFVIGIIVPSQLGIVPMYSLIRSIGLVGKHIGMILVYTCQLMPMTVFLYTGFIAQLPKDYEEAAVVDGAKLPSVFARIVLPQLMPITGTVAVLNSLNIWNDLFTQMIFLSGTKTATVPVGIYSLTFSNISRWNIIYAAVVISVAPILLFYLISQKKMMNSFSGGLKG